MYVVDYTDDESLSGETRLWRRMAPEWYKREVDSFSSQGFQDSSRDGTAMSANIAELTTIVAMVRDYPNHYVAEFTVEAVRELGFGVQKRPLPDDASHVEVFGKKTSSKRKALAKLSRKVYDPTNP